MRHLIHLVFVSIFALPLAACGGGGGGSAGDGDFIVGLPSGAPTEGTAWFRARHGDRVFRALSGTLWLDGSSSHLEFVEADGTSIRRHEGEIRYQTLRRGDRATFRHVSRGLDAHGAISRDGEIAAFAKLQSSVPGLIVNVRAGVPTVASMRGLYRLVGMSKSGMFHVHDGGMRFDGSGGVRISEIVQNEGPYTLGVENDATYRFDVNGRLFIQRGDSLLLGTVSRNGDFAVLAGDIGPTRTPTWYLLVRDFPGAQARHINGDYTVVTLRRSSQPGAFIASRGHLEPTAVGAGTRWITESNRESVYSIARSPVYVGMSWSMAADGTVRINRARLPYARGVIGPSANVVALVNDRGPNTDPFVELWIRH